MARTSNTKENILQNALVVFAEKGYEASSVADIAETLGIGKSALYKHYKNKRDIFDSILLRMEEREAAFKEQYCYVGADGTPDFKKLEEYVFALFCKWTEDPFCAAFRKVLTLEQFTNSEMAGLYRKYLTEGPVFELTETFSAPARITRSMSATQLIPPPTANGMRMAFATASTILMSIGRRSADAVMS